MRWVVVTVWKTIKDTVALIRPFVESFIWEDVPEWILYLGGVAFIFLVGFVVTVVIGHYYRKVPWLGIFVDGTRRLVSIIFSKNEEKEKKGGKGEVVLVEYPKERAWSLGVVTEAHMEKGIRMLRILVSKVPTFWTGDLVFYPEEDIVHTGISKPEWLTMVTTAGTYGGEAELDKALREVRRRMEEEWREVASEVKKQLREKKIEFPKEGKLEF